MAHPADGLIAKYFGNWEHPYHRFDREVDALVRPGGTLVDAGCGRTAPVLQRYRGRGLRLVGLDCVDFPDQIEGLELYQRDLVDTGLASQSVDVVMARSVIEHVVDPDRAYSEVCRILKPGGHFVFLTANMWDYASLIACAVPNNWHPWIVHHVEGRAENDVFPTAYKSNTKRQVNSLAKRTGFNVNRFEYLGQYPNYFLFSKPLFLLGTAYEKIIARFTFLHWLRGWILVTLQKANHTRA